jgi:hypothetical protein
MAQYTIEMDYDLLKSIPGVNFEMAQPIIKEVMHDLADNLSEVGWSAQKNDNPSNFRVRFWLNDATIQKIVEQEILQNKKKFRSLFIGFVENFLGKEAKNKFSIAEKEVIKEKIKAHSEKGIEQYLLVFKGMPSVSVMKGTKALFIEELEEKNKNKMKYH